MKKKYPTGKKLKSLNDLKEGVYFVEILGSDDWYFGKIISYKDEKPRNKENYPIITAKIIKISRAENWGYPMKEGNIISFFSETKLLSKIKILSYEEAIAEAL